MNSTIYYSFIYKFVFIASIYFGVNEIRFVRLEMEIILKSVGLLDFQTLKYFMCCFSNSINKLHLLKRSRENRKKNIKKRFNRRFNHAIMAVIYPLFYSIFEDDDYLHKKRYSIFFGHFDPNLSFHLYA